MAPLNINIYEFILSRNTEERGELQESKDSQVH